MYILVNTETADVQKFETIDDMILACMKKNGILHSISSAASAVASTILGRAAAPAPPMSTPLPPSPTINAAAPVAAEQPSLDSIIATFNTHSNTTVSPSTVDARQTTLFSVPCINPFNQSSGHRVEWAALDDARRLGGTEAEQQIMKDTVNRAKESVEELEDRTMNEIDALARYKELNKLIQTRKAPKMPYNEYMSLIHELYTNEFASRYTAGTTTAIEKTKFAMPAWRLFLHFPTKFGGYNEKYKPLFDTDLSHMYSRHCIDGVNMPILNPTCEKFEKFYEFATILKIAFEDVTKFTYESVEELSFISYKTVLSNEINVEFMEQWIKAFLSKATKKSENDSIKSSTLYEAFLECVRNVLKSDSNVICGSVLEFIEGNISQKVFSRILKSSLGWKSQRKSDGVYWLSVGFGSDSATPLTTAAGTLLDEVGYFDEGEGFATVENTNPGIPPKATRSAIHSYTIMNPLSIAGDGETDTKPPAYSLGNETLGVLRKKSHGAAALRVFDEKLIA